MALQRLDLRASRRGSDQALPRPRAAGAEVSGAVADIITQVREGGDGALRRLTARLDRVHLDRLVLPPSELDAALERIPAELRRALELAHRRIVDFHAWEAGEVPTEVFEEEGVSVRLLVRPVERAGCYAPGGRARYPSTVLMCAAPARVAGVGEVSLCVPPGPDGTIDDATLAAARLAGVDRVHPIGGAQAVAAMAYGTESVQAVDVVVGPGNRYVAEAKRQLSGVVGVASAFAGPSEVVVVAGPGAPAELAAIDLVVQAEHGPDGAAWLLTWDPQVLEAVDEEVAGIVAGSARRQDLEATLRRGGFACLVDDVDQAMEVANTVAPEHLELMVDQPEALLSSVTAAGAVFCGSSSPASVGDYLAGPNHVLPTDRSARFGSALRVDDFRRHIHAVTVSPRALATLGPSVVTLAHTEGLPGHAESIERRLAPS